jgi:hypothetical protein
MRTFADGLVNLVRVHVLWLFMGMFPHRYLLLIPALTGLPRSSQWRSTGKHSESPMPFPQVSTRRSRGRSALQEFRALSRVLADLMIQKVWWLSSADIIEFNFSSELPNYGFTTLFISLFFLVSALLTL